MGSFDTSSERAIALITAFGASFIHEDAGQVVLDIVDEMADELFAAASEAEEIAARDGLFNTIVGLLGVLHGALDRLDLGIDREDMMQHVVQDAQRRSHSE